MGWRGPVGFQTYVYDTNVGDIAPLSTYFNPHNWTEYDLNERFARKGTLFEIQTAIQSSKGPTKTTPDKDHFKPKSASLMPKLMVWAEKDPNADLWSAIKASNLAAAGQVKCTSRNVLEEARMEGE